MKDNLNDFPIPRYKFIGQTRNNKQGGEAGLYIYQSYQFIERPDLLINLENAIEAEFIELNLQPSKIFMGIIYCNGADADINRSFQSLNFLTAPHRRNAL